MKNQILLSALIILIISVSSYNNVHSGDQNTGLEERFQRSTILMIVGDDNETVEPGQGTGDVFIRNRLEKVMGHEVILFIETESPTTLYEAVEFAD